MKKETIIQCVIIIILIATLGGFLYFMLGSNSNHETQQNSPMGQMPGGMGNSSSSVETTGAVEVTDEQTLTGNYETTTADESAIKVSDGGNLTLEGATITKSGDSTNTENSEFYGVNAGVLTTKGSTTTIRNSNITTSAKGANAVFATGENAKVYVYDTTITTTGSSSARGLDATYGGYIEADNVTISTLGRKLCNTCNRSRRRNGYC